MGKADSQEIKEGGQTDIDDMGLKYAGKYSDLEGRRLDPIHQATTAWPGLCLTGEKIDGAGAVFSVRNLMRNDRRMAGFGEVHTVRKYLQYLIFDQV